MVIGWGTNSECIYSFVTICPWCKEKTRMKIYETSSHANIYFIPLGKFNKQMYLHCPMCDRGTEIDQNDYDKIVREVNKSKEDEKRQEIAQKHLGVQVLVGKQAGLVFPMNDKRTIHLGKSMSEVDVMFDKSYTKVSRKHCAVKYQEQENCYLVTDFSSNGTYLQNGQRLVKNSPKKVPRGTILKLADDSCRIKLL